MKTICLNVLRTWLGFTAVFIAAALLAMAAIAVQAAEPVPAIAGQVRGMLADDAVLRGAFEQRKSVKGFKNPLVSRGDFLIARDRGLAWRTREPFASSLVITRDKLVSRQGDGTVASQMSASTEPGLRAINEMLFALMSADLRALAQRFRIEGELVGGQGWRLVLTPRDAALAQWVTRIELTGDKYVRTVHLVEAQGDSSMIRFSDQQGAPSLTREEAARFE